MVLYDARLIVTDSYLLKLPTKFLIVIEVILCFGPAAILLLIGALLIPNQITAFNHEPIDWQTGTLLIGSVACGLIGLITLAYVLGNLFSNSQTIDRPILVCTGIALGLLPLSPAVFPDSTERWIGLLPIAATLHILFLSRRMLFRSYQDALKPVLVATTITLSLPFLFEAFPFGISEAELELQRDMWRDQRPTQYEYTFQLSGWFRPDMLYPKRISVKNGVVASATYASSNRRHKEGDSAPTDTVWMIDQAFDELLEAKRSGETVIARFNHRWGYIENASVDSEEERSSWSIEIREFRALSSEMQLLD